MLQFQLKCQIVYVNVHSAHEVKYQIAIEQYTSDILPHNRRGP